MKTNSIYIYIRIFTISILKVGKKKNNYLEKKSIFSSTWNTCFKLPKITGLIQMLASALEKYNYINFVFETNANNN
jgi:hypothetical protein